MTQQQNKMKNWVLGITGGIGCGKTAISDMLIQQGITVVDADIVAREVVQPNSQGLKAITEHFGTAILLPDGTLNRAALREIIFTQNEQKQWLNALLHPLIRQEILQQLNNTSSAYSVLVAPLLFENSLERYCHRTLLIDIPKEQQIKRTMARDNISLAQTLSIIASQMARADKQQKADDMLDNNRPLTVVKESLLLLHKQYLQYAKQYKSDVN